MLSIQETMPVNLLRRKSTKFSWYHSHLSHLQTAMFG